MSEMTFYYGTMGCGKSTYALQRIHNLDREGFWPKLVKPIMDTRDAGVVKSRMGPSYPCYLIQPDHDLNLIVDPTTTHVVCDEAQFLSIQNVLDLARLVDSRGIQVDLFGLRTAYTGDLFAASAKIMAIADNLVELPMIYRDGHKANMHIRFVDGEPIFDGDAIFVGDVNEEYESVSRKEYFTRRTD